MTKFVIIKENTCHLQCSQVVLAIVPGYCIESTTIHTLNRKKFGGIKVWRISKEINLAEESLANFSMQSIVIFVLKSRMGRRSVKQ